MSTISEVMKEMQGIYVELKEINAKARILRARKKILERSITEYLEDNETPGIKYHDLVILKATGTSRKPKSKKEKEESLSSVLEELGISDTKSASEAVKRALSGESKEVTKLKIKQNLPEIF